MSNEEHSARVNFSAIWNAEEDRYDLVSGDGRTLAHLVSLDVGPVADQHGIARPDIPPAEVMLATATVIGAPLHPEGTPRLASDEVYVGLRTDVRAAGAVLWACDAVSGTPLGGLTGVEARDSIGEAFSVTFTMHVRSNEPSPEHLAAKVDADEVARQNRETFGVGEYAGAGTAAPESNAAGDVFEHAAAGSSAGDGR